MFEHQRRRGACDLRPAVESFDELAQRLGVGGGFMLVPAMIYLLGIPTSVTIGTSLFQVTFVTARRL